MLPTDFSKKVKDAIDNGDINKSENRLAFIRECVTYFESRLPRPTTEEYSAISKAFCDRYPILRRGNITNYWVNKP